MWPTSHEQPGVAAKVPVLATEEKPRVESQRAGTERHAYRHRVADPKLHHFVPQFYLRRFASDSERVAVRHRTRGTHVSSVENTAARNGFYKVPTRPLTAEYTLGDFEAATGAAFDALCSGKLPASGTAERDALGLFMGLQLNRTPDSMAILRFVYGALQDLGPGPISEASMGKHLTRLYGFEPEAPEVGAACDFANAALGDSRTDAEIREHQLELMFKMGLQTAPFLQARSWSLEAPKDEVLITSDRPVVLWNPERPEDEYMGVGLLEAEEVWLVVDPARMLVLRRQGPERIKRMGPERVSFVNHHIARHCAEEIISHPDAEAELAELPLSRVRPVLRFWRGPLVSSTDGAEILQAWVPIRDISEAQVDRRS